MQDYAEYEFTLPDGSKRYEMVDTRDELAEVRQIQRMHNATKARKLPA